MERTITICYHWKHEADEDIPQDHQNELEELAHERLVYFLRTGHVGGELVACIDDIDYRGWLTISKQEAP